MSVYPSAAACAALAFEVASAEAVASAAACAALAFEVASAEAADCADDAEPAAS